MIKRKFLKGGEANKGGIHSSKSSISDIANDAYKNE